MFTTVLVANRGEIAVRVIRTLRSMGIRSVAVYSEADAGALHTRVADLAVPIGPAPAAQSYLSIERVLQACRVTGAGPGGSHGCHCAPRNPRLRTTYVVRCTELFPTVVEDP